MAQWVAEQFEESRPRLRAIAYRMLGSSTEADDAVQEAWLRLSRTGPESIDNLGGWLTTVVSRVCLDMIRSRNSRREDSVEAILPGGEPAADRPRFPGARRRSRRFSWPGTDARSRFVGTRRAAGLRTARPLWRLLRGDRSDRGSFAGRRTAAGQSSPPAASRRFGHPGQSATSTTDIARQHKLVDAFLAASREGDFEALVSLLNDDVVLRADHVAVESATARQARGAPPLKEVIRGGEQVARVFLGRAAAAKPALVNGMPGAVWAPGGKPRGVFVFTCREGSVVQLEVVADPIADPRARPGVLNAGISTATGRPLSTRLNQQMRGSGSPTSMSTIRVPPKPVRKTTMPSGWSRISPIAAASRPRGCCRSAPSAWSTSFAGDHRQHLALVGHVQRVDAEEVARAGDGRGDGQGGLVEYHGDLRIPGELVTDRADAATGGVS